MSIRVPEPNRSLKTFPVDGLTLTAFFLAMLLARCRDRAVPFAANLQVPLTSSALSSRTRGGRRLPCARRHAASTTSGLWLFVRDSD
jgi:hypothetical protein